MDQTSTTSNEFLLEKDGSFLTAEKYLDERMFVNILGFLKIDNEEERAEIFTSELPAEVLDDKFTFIRMEEPLNKSKSACSSPTSPQQKVEKPPRITKPTMKEILDGSYNKKIQKEAVKRNPILLLSKNVSGLSLEDEPSMSIEEIVEAEIVSFKIIMMKLTTIKNSELERLKSKRRTEIEKEIAQSTISGESPEKEEKESIIYFTEDPYRNIKNKRESQTRNDGKKKYAQREEIGNIKSVLLNQFELTNVLTHQLNELKRKKQ